MGLFSRKSPLEKLEQKHAKLLDEAYKLSTTNRTESDKKYAEAKEIENQIESLQKAK